MDNEERNWHRVSDVKYVEEAATAAIAAIGRDFEIVSADRFVPNGPGSREDNCREMWCVRVKDYPEIRHCLGGGEGHGEMTEKFRRSLLALSE